MLALDDINRGDIIELDYNGQNYTFGDGRKKGEEVVLNISSQLKIKKGVCLRRIRNQNLINNIKNDILDKI